MVFIPKKTHCVDMYKEGTDKSFVISNVFFLHNNNNLISTSKVQDYTSPFSVYAPVCNSYLHMPPGKPLYPLRVLIF